MSGSAWQPDYRLLERIHECVEAPSAWNDVSDAIGRDLGGRVLLIEFGPDHKPNGAHADINEVNCLVYWLNGLQVEGGNALHFLLDHADVHYPYWKATEISSSRPPVDALEDWTTRSLLITPVFKSQEKVILLAAIWEAPETDTLTFDSALTRLRPYARALSRSLTVCERLHTATRDLAAYRSMLTHQKHAAILVDETLRILVTTPAATALLQKGDLFRSDNGELAAVHPSLEPPLASLKRFLAGIRRPLSRKLLMAAVTDPEKSILLSQPEEGYFHVHMQGIVEEERKAAPGTGNYILVEIRSSSSIEPQIREFLQTRFGLSQSEARLAHDLSVSASLSATLDNLSITRNTAKTHLRRIYEKTDTQSQLELARLLHRLGGLF